MTEPHDEKKDAPSGEPTAPGEMAHEEARELLDAWRDGELEDPEAVRVEAHVKTCEKCKRVDELLGGGLKQAIAGAPESSTEILPGVQRRIRLRSRGRFYGSDDKQRKMPSPWPLMIASLALLAALVISYLLLGQVGTASVAPSGTAPAPSTTSSQAP
jgi:predicted anti-sigma-YlaC factor YlaD